MGHLVIGVGNPDRGDDGAGAMVARALGGERSRELADCTDLIDAWEGEDDVVVVDAVRSGGAPGTVLCFDALSDELPAKANPSSHSFGVAETVELARGLGRLPGKLTVYGIEASDFELGGTMTAPVAEAVARVVRVLEAG